MSLIRRATGRRLVNWWLISPYHAYMSNGRRADLVRLGDPSPWAFETKPMNEAWKTRFDSHSRP